MPNWKDGAVLERLIAAIVASNGCKIDNMMVARYFGEDITYDAVENRTRVYRKKAKELAEEAQAAGRMEQNMRVKSANTTPRKPKTMSKSVLDGGVATGRVTKSTPTKKNKVKNEPAASSDSSVFGDTQSASTGAEFEFHNVDFEGMHAGAFEDWDESIA